MLLPQEIKKEQSMDIDNTVQFDICFGRSYKGHRKIFNPGAKNNDDGLFALIVKAFQWQETLNKQHVKLDDLASSLGLSRGYVGKVVKLTCLSPEIIQRIYDGDYPDTCKTGLLLESEIPLLWSEQKIKYGFA
jgi:hypothetical protein